MDGSILHIELMDRPVPRANQGENYANSSCLDDGVECLIIVNLGRCVNPRRTQWASYLSREPSTCLYLNIHFLVTTFALVGRGTRSHVWLPRRPEYFSSMALYKWGLSGARYGSESLNVKSKVRLLVLGLLVSRMPWVLATGEMGTTPMGREGFCLT